MRVALSHLLGCVVCAPPCSVFQCHSVCCTPSCRGCYCLCGALQCPLQCCPHKNLLLSWSLCVHMWWRGTLGWWILLENCNTQQKLAEHAAHTHAQRWSTHLHGNQLPRLIALTSWIAISCLHIALVGWYSFRTSRSCGPKLQRTYPPEMHNAFSGQHGCGIRIPQGATLRSLPTYIGGLASFRHLRQQDSKWHQHSSMFGRSARHDLSQ